MKTIKKNVRLSMCEVSTLHTDYITLEILVKLWGFLPKWKPVEFVDVHEVIGLTTLQIYKVLRRKRLGLKRLNNSPAYKEIDYNKFC